MPGYCGSHPPTLRAPTERMHAMTGRRRYTPQIVLATALLLAASGASAAAAAPSLAQAQAALDTAMQKDAAGNPNQGDDVMGELFRPRLTALVGCLPAAEQTTPGAVDCLVTGQAGPSEKHMALRFLPTANGWQLQHSDTEMEVAAPVPDNARVQVLLREDFSKKLVTERNEAVRKSLEQAVSTAQVLAVERCAVSEHAPVVACTVQASAANERGELPMQFALVDGQWQNATPAH
ncbi:conserved hypothetical protein [Xanthomonas campestris pv. campestris str. 8004]|uniref:Secreted protein n=3 Tax=Xanthomonas campestris TaxID=339 RepID=Q8PB47_XANCP|nr:hypothetical protein XCC1278 [Xanthomonas campestris pv. campestris str. ATCC 33913]AAY50011.1 conserved hypothetical protein [Xanthomonas campestris pv. campestris str. 8004]QCX67553.1 hypothetical protein DFG55_15010 [Xanthomonas campestris pv. campestris]QCX71951.1 hypothetical protein DFG54_15410 [Xanthomonas campestris pv. campestris]